MVDTTSYQGLQDASSTAHELSALRFIVDRVANRLATATLVQVKKAPYDSQGNAIQQGTVGPIGFIDVLPLVNQLDGGNNSTKHEVIHGFPYFRFQGGTNGAVIVDPQVGDIGLAVFCQHDISAVKSSYAQSNPGSRRKFDWSDGIYFGLSLSKDTPTQYITFTKDQSGNQGITVVDSNKNSIKMTNTGIAFADNNNNTITMNSSGVLINGALINSSGDVITKAGHNLDTHIHSGVTVGSSNTGQPV